MLEQADGRRPGSAVQGCFQVTGEAGALAVAGVEGFRCVRPEP